MADKKALEETPNRRDFLCAAAAGTAAAASFGVIALVLPKEADGASGIPETLDYDWTKHQWVYLIDTTLCIGCGACARGCRSENNVPESVYRTWIERYEMVFDKEPHVDSPAGGAKGFDPTPGHHAGKSFFVPKLCNHCAATPCTQVCPVGASYSTPDGVVLVDQDHCIGCGYCVQACPYGSRYMHPVDHVADKCTWCYHRITHGAKPACVQSCPVGARQFGNRKNPDDPINKRLNTERLHVLQPQLRTKPRCYYFGLSREVR